MRQKILISRRAPVRVASEVVRILLAMVGLAKEATPKWKWNAKRKVRLGMKLAGGEGEVP